MILETERLFLRELTPADCGALLLVLGDAENMQRYRERCFGRTMLTT